MLEDMINPIFICIDNEGMLAPDSNRFEAWVGKGLPGNAYGVVGKTAHNVLWLSIENRLCCQMMTIKEALLCYILDERVLGGMKKY